MSRGVHTLIHDYLPPLHWHVPICTKSVGAQMHCPNKELLVRDAGYRTMGMLCWDQAWLSHREGGAQNTNHQTFAPNALYSVH